MSSNEPLSTEEWRQLTRLLERWQRQVGASSGLYGMITALLAQAMQRYVSAPAQPLLTGKYSVSAQNRTRAMEDVL